MSKNATQDRAAELLEDARLRLCSILSAVNGLRTEEARALVLGLRDEIERYQERT
jgi:hypothetical protein